MPEPIVDISNLTHTYGKLVALRDLSLRIDDGAVFGFLGPNGSGKTTLFRILSTLIPVESGRVKILGYDPATAYDQVRAGIGVVFQSPSLDTQLTARENLTHQGHLYGLSGATLRERVERALAAVNLGDRANERVSRFSGGMRRRVEIAKGMLHQPRVLLLDEPSTGLDPSARIDLWRELRRLNQEQGVTVLITTHLMDEADRCSRLAILSEGVLLACDAPAALKQRIGGDVVTLTSSRPEELRTAIRQRLGIEAAQIDGTLRFERDAAHQFVPQLIEAVPGMIDSVAVGKPTLEDVFIQLTGRKLQTDGDPAPMSASRRH